MMPALMRKDLRLLRPVLIAAAVVAVLFYGVFPWPGFLEQHRRDRLYLQMVHHPAGGEWPYRWQFYASRFTQDAAVWAGLAWVAGLLLIAAVAGTAFALERRERWGAFAAMLPVPRTRAVGAKLAVSLGVCLAMSAVNLAVFVVGHWLGSGRLGTLAGTIASVDAAGAMVWTGMAVGVFGVGWLASVLLPSPVVATAVALAAGALAWAAVLPLLDGYGTAWNPLVWTSAGVLGGAGVVCTAAGRVVQVRRTSI